MSHPARRAQSFRASFVAVVGAFASLEGCSTALDTDGLDLDSLLCPDGGTAPGCVPEQCPKDIPTHGKRCEESELACSWGSPGCASVNATALCRDGAWQVNVPRCATTPPTPTPTTVPTPTPTPVPFDTACPASGRPKYGSPCLSGLTCDYDFCGDRPTETHACVNGAWSLPEHSSCNPPAPVCPGDLPSDGAYCDPYTPPECVYAYCGGTVTARCAESLWRVAVPTCNPPPPLDCPVSVPAEDAACVFGVGQCDYGEFLATCPNGQWDVTINPLYNPPAPTMCPTSRPLSGATCSHIGASCNYGACSTTLYGADCVNGRWEVNSLSCHD